ncbi:hydrogenase nickel incorporation protein HypB [Vogesella perlucida]|nr:hydrogenase nickel incorporation protein HypB [Vogesella perlucida]
MCTVCGCAEGNVSIEGQKPAVKYPYRPRRAGGHAHGHHHHHDHDHSHAHPHQHDHDHGHAHAQPAAEAADAADSTPVTLADGSHHYGHGPAHAHAPGLSQARMVKIEQDILSKNNQYAAANRRRLAERGIFALNLVSSPGSGKTTLLTETVQRLAASTPLAVIEGDQQTAHDAERIRAAGAPAIQINTGKGCHLDAHMVGQALDALALQDDSLLLIENVGNLVCPAAFDLGEAHKVAILSVTEGEDKPLKYPDMFAAASLMVLTKTDLLPHLDFNVDACIAYARRVNPAIEVLQLSARNGDGMDAWLQWLAGGLIEARALRAERVAQQNQLAELKAQVAALEARLAQG